MLAENQLLLKDATKTDSNDQIANTYSPDSSHGKQTDTKDTVCTETIGSVAVEKEQGQVLVFG